MTTDKYAGATPGPWREGVEGNNRVYGPDGMGEHSGLVAIVYKGPANKRLIADSWTLAAENAELRAALDPDSLEAIADEIGGEFKHSARAASLRAIAKWQRAAMKDAEYDEHV